MVIVPDASIILKWVLPPNISPYQNLALNIRNAANKGEHKLLVPPLWRYEVGNTLTRLISKNSFKLITLCESVGLIEIPADNDWLKQAISLVQKNKVSFYDASYHALAIRESGIFITADEKYVRKILDKTHVKLLKEWK